MNGKILTMMRTMRLYSPFLCAAILFGMIALTVSSCITNDIVPNEEEELRFDIKVINESSIGTKVVKTDWEVGDYIFITTSLGMWAAQEKNMLL